MNKILDAALYEAIAAKQVGEVRSLLACGADANAPGPDSISSPYEITPLRQALEPEIEPSMETPMKEVLEGQVGQSAILQLLLEYGANPNAETPLLKATYFGFIASVRLLLRYGADPNQEDGEGTALSDAEKFGYKAIIEILKEAGGHY